MQLLSSPSPRHDIPRESNLKLCMGRIEEAGYAVQCLLLNSVWYGLPQSRARVYFICIRKNCKDIATPVDKFFDHMKMVLRMLYLPAPPVVVQLHSSLLLSKHLAKRNIINHHHHIAHTDAYILIIILFHQHQS